MLYMLVRHQKPRTVFEMAPNKGYSSHWILQALEENDRENNFVSTNSTLTSIDLHSFSVSEMNPKFLPRWKFFRGDYLELKKRGKYDIDSFDMIFIDALHTEEFSRSYVQHLLLPLRNPKQVIIHDIVADAYGGGRESGEVYKYLAFTNQAVSNIFSLATSCLPTLYDHAPEALFQINRMRAHHKITAPCFPQSICNSSMHDHLYFNCSSSPSIFFSLYSGINNRNFKAIEVMRD